MKRILVAAFLFLSACHRSSAPPALHSFRVLTHDSFVSKHGLGPKVASAFEKNCGARIEWSVAGDAGQMVERLKLAQTRGVRDVEAVVGVDSLQWDRVREFVDESFQQKGVSWVAGARAAAAISGFIPYDLGWFGFIADREALRELKLEMPRTWSEVLQPSWKGRLLIEDPRSSTPGFAWLMLTQTLHGTDAPKFWKMLRPSVLAFSPGWDQAYGLFLKKKAPLVWSYVSSQAYHSHETPGQTRYQAVLLDGVSLSQVEGAAKLKGAEDSRVLQCFFQVLLSAEVQSAIPESQWMWPAVEGTPLPPSFAGLPMPSRVLETQWTSQQAQKFLDQWRASQ